MCVSILNFERYCLLQGCSNKTPTRSGQGGTLVPVPRLLQWYISIFAHLEDKTGYDIIVLISDSLTTRGAESIFHVLTGHSDCVLGICMSMCFAHFSRGLFILVLFILSIPYKRIQLSLCYMSSMLLLGIFSQNSMCTVILCMCVVLSHFGCVRLCASL